MSRPYIHQATFDMVGDLWGSKNVQVLDADEKKKYLANKRTGGRNFEKGHNFENRFATGKIAELLFCYFESNEDAAVSSQRDGFFVDDLVVEKQNGDLSCWQLKNADKVSWGNGSKSSIVFDFYHQDQEPRPAELNLRLITNSEQTASGLRNKKPAKLPSCADVEVFPNKVLLQLIQDGHLSSSLGAIAKSSQPNLSLLNQIGLAILATWSETDGSASVSEILTKLTTGIQAKLLRAQITAEEEAQALRPAVREILDGIEHFKYKVDRGYLHCSYLGTEQTLGFDCLSRKFQTVQDWIETNRPIKYEDEFESMLNTWSDDYDS